MAAPLPGGATRLDAALDAAVAVALTADALGDRCGAIAFADRPLVELPPRRGGGEVLARALSALEPSPVDSDHERAFQAVAGRRRALVLVLCDLLDEAAARSLVRAVPVLNRRHEVVVAACRDPEVETELRQAPQGPAGVARMAVAVEVDEARSAAARAITRAGAEVLEARADVLSARCVGAYLRAKRAARL